MPRFKLQSHFEPTGDQPQAIEKLTDGILTGVKNQVLLGVTGSGKTYTIANVIERVQKPALVISHNKTLAWQLYKEFKDFFPQNAVHYFVSYYDYYQPEAYIPQSNTYIEKDARINEKIDQMRHAATQDLLVRDDVIVVASVSCIYNIGSSEDYKNLSLDILLGQKISRKELLAHIVALGYARNEIDPKPGNFRAHGERIEVYPATGEKVIIIEISQDKIAKITEGKLDKTKSLHTKHIVPNTRLFPAHFWATPEHKQKIAIVNIRNELSDRLKFLRSRGKLLEAQRLEQKTNFDLEIIEETGFCHGIENYSRHFDFRRPGEAPYTLLDFFPYANKDFLTVIDESHMTIPQIRGMYFGDRSRKETLVEYGFRLPSALDNRPLTFAEFLKRIGRTIFVSATPAEYELKKSYAGSETSHIAQQLVRPTGLLDPSIEIRRTKNQMADLIKEIEKRVKKNQKVLVTTITKRLAEDIAEYLCERNIKAYYLHSEIHTLDRPKILHDLRSGTHDVVVGVNPLREGLDLPEVSLVVILDADKEGFLRNDTTLIQTMGRAARHVDGHAILYADIITDSMKRAIRETERRRKIQQKYNEAHAITPKSIEKPLEENYPEESIPQGRSKEKSGKEISHLDNTSLYYLEREMKKAAKAFDFEKAAALRDKIKLFDKTFNT
ncbi:MAG: excinuclease ABC subunit UvrB [Candidatus Spechtbacteria bacterium]|nr:excinuclease ABC subunit UvrB [Candidatus Spechtbacteria bacterium]